MSPDETFLVELMRAVATAQLESLVVGSTAAVLQGAPLMTQDVDLLVRDTPRNRQKILEVASALAATKPRPMGELTTVVRINRAGIDVDFVFDELTPELSFESLRTRAVEVSLGELQVMAVSLADLIVAKEFAGRPKDLAQLPIIRATAAVREKLLKK